MLPQKIKWFIHPILAAPIKDIERRFKLITDDLNYILAKTNERRLIYDGVSIVSQRPNDYNFPIGWKGATKLPVENFDMWCWINYVPGRTTGAAGWHYDGTGVWECGFDKIADPENPNYEYDTQLYVFLHEYAHNFGGGIGEYYRSAIVPDTTGIEPFLTISTLDPDCRYWSKRPDFLADPLLRNSNPWTTMQYSELTATIIDSCKYRISTVLPKIVPESDVLIAVFNSDWQRIPNARVEVWKGLKGSVERYKIGMTDSDGHLVINWGIDNIDQMTTDAVRLVKVYANGYLSAATHFTLWDQQFWGTCRNRTRMLVRVMMLRNSLELTDEIQDQISEVDGCIGWSIGPGMKAPMLPRMYRLPATCVSCEKSLKS